MLPWRKQFSVFVLVIMLASVLSGCTPKPVPTPDPDPTPPPDPTPALVPAEVLTEAAINFMNNIPDNAIMAPDVALGLMEENPDAIFWIDMRSADDYAKGHIAGAVNLPYAKTGELLGVIPANRQVVFQCYSGQTSAQTTALLQILGYNAVSFRGGMNFGWAPLELGEDTLETTANALPAAKNPELDEKGQILWDGVVGYFSDSNYVVPAAALNELVEENPDAIMVLDIRSAEDFAKGHIEGAVHIAYREVGQNFDRLPTNRPIYIVCYTGQTAGITLGALRLAGYNAYSLNRGMTGWDAAELPKVTE